MWFAAVSIEEITGSKKLVVLLQFPNYLYRQDLKDNLPIYSRRILVKDLNRFLKSPKTQSILNIINLILIS